VQSLAANPAQQQYERDAGPKNIILKARQMGITTWIAARFFLDVITHRGLLAVQVAHDQQAAEEIFRIVHRFWTNLPEEWRAGALKPSRSNIRQIVFPHLDSEYRVEGERVAMDLRRQLAVQEGGEVRLSAVGEKEMDLPGEAGEMIGDGQRAAGIALLGD